MTKQYQRQPIKINSVERQFSQRCSVWICLGQQVRGWVLDQSGRRVLERLLKHCSWQNSWPRGHPAHTLSAQDSDNSKLSLGVNINLKGSGRDIIMILCSHLVYNLYLDSLGSRTWDAGRKFIRESPGEHQSAKESRMRIGQRERVNCHQPQHRSQPINYWGSPELAEPTRFPHTGGESDKTYYLW